MKVKVVFHIDDVNRWPRVKGNVQNLLKETQEIAVIILANSDAVQGYLSEENQAFIQTIPIVFHACRNALRGQKISEDKLPDTVKVVPAGVLDLIELQTQGYSYIKV